MIRGRTAHPATALSIDVSKPTGESHHWPSPVVVRAHLFFSCLSPIPLICARLWNVYARTDKTGCVTRLMLLYVHSFHSYPLTEARLRD
jgi:hypothetical protein